MARAIRAGRVATRFDHIIPVDASRAPRTLPYACATLAFIVLSASTPAVAQYQSTAVALPTVDVTAETVAAPAAASEKQIPAERITDNPASRPGELLEAAPGLIVTQHSGEGKANQYYLRGFNLDHGTDLAITVDGMPVNMRTHGHGQGYADTNFIIPELIGQMRVRKGPYFADEGDFSSAGALRLDYIDRLNKGIVAGTIGSFGYRRGVAAKSFELPGWAGTVLVAGEATTYEGPWDVADRLRKLNGVVRYSQGTDADGFSLTAMGYANRWTSTDQVAARAVDSGEIGRFGSLDPSDGGEASRFSLSGRWSRDSAESASRVEAYAIHQAMRLYSNFTYFLDNQTEGDQFSQRDRRAILGLNASHTFKGQLAGRRSDTTIGLQARHDDIGLGLAKTFERNFLSTVRDDQVTESSVGLYAQNLTHWTEWVRTTVGVRGDWYRAKVESDLTANSGDASDFIASPKFGVVFGPFANTELFVNYGTGFHSNDVRGVTITTDPNTLAPADRVPFLVRSKGGEIGIRTIAINGLESSVALFALDFDSELLFVGDAGTTEASRPSRRVGVEWTNHYKVNSWLGLDADIAFTRARFRDDDPAGNRIPGAPNVVASAGIVLGRDLGWFGSLKLRYFGPRPLVEDDSERSSATTLVNGRIGYRFENGVRVHLDAYNLFNVKASQIDYFYESQLRNEAGPIADRHVHPVEPLAVRLTVAAQF